MNNTKNMGDLKQLKASLQKECNYIKSIFSVLSVPSRLSDENNDQDDDYVYINAKNAVNVDEDKCVQRAQSIVELQQRLEKMKQDNNFSIKNKLMKKSLNTKLTKKARKAQRKLQTQLKNKNKTPNSFHVEKDNDVKPENVHKVKPVFNSDGKLVFSKFDFTNVGRKSDKKIKLAKDPKRILDNLKKQDDIVKQLQESGDTEKAAEFKEKIAWRNALSKAEGEKVKDDPLLLKKSLQRVVHKKKQSKKKWDERIKSVEQGKQDRQKKREENITQKKKEKKSKQMKKNMKKGRIFV